MMKALLSVLFLFFISNSCYGYSVKQLHNEALEKTYYNKAIEYAVQGKFEQSQDKLQEALKLGSFSTFAESGLQVIKDAIKQKIEKERAIQIFKASDYVEKHKFKEAVAECDKLIGSGIQYASVYIDRAAAYINLFQPDDKAISDFTKAIEIEPNCFTAYYYRGIRWEIKNELDKAISDYTKAIEIEPNYLYAYKYRASVYLRQGLQNKAYADFEKILEIDPAEPEAYFQMARKYESGGNIKEAIKAYKNFIHYAKEADGYLVAVSDGYFFGIKEATKKISELEK